MVAKISVGNNLYGALNYNQEKVNEGLGKILATNMVHEPTDGNFTVSACIEDFEHWMPSHFRTKKPIIHISLNPHPDDRLSNDQLAEIGREYMEKLGYGNQPYMIFKHEDIGREHIHIVSLRVDSEGKKINDSNEFRRSKEITEQLEQKYSLHPAEGQKRGEQWELKAVDYSKGDVKKQIASVIRPLAAMYHFQSIGEYKAVLSLYNIHMEELKGEVKGKTYKGILYSAVNDRGEKVGSPLKSSIFGKTVGYEGLEKRMNKSVERLKANNWKLHTLKAVANAKSTCGSESEFRAALKVQQIDVLFRRNDQDRIYGATFIDHTTRTVLNGSRLGKDFSANVFNDLFDSGQTSVTTQIKQEATRQVQSTPAKTENTQVDVSLGSLFGLSPSAEEKEFMPYRKRKKKRRYGRQD